MTKRIICALVSLLLILTLFTACKKDESLVGTWKNDDDGVKILYLFDDDGMGYVLSDNEAIKFGWTLEGSTLSITVGESTSKSTVSIDKDTMTLTDEQETVIFKKVK